MGRRPKVDVVGFIADKIQGYVGHTAIISELLQNADDARATTVSFYFDLDCLVVRNNSLFSEDDWHNIDNIASHTKRDQKEKIGTFGTGFVSVYHITDRPEILSGNYHRVIDPQADEDTPDDITSHIDYTEFRLPWRFTEAAFSREIQADIWTQERIEGFWKDAEAFISTASIFLRHVRLISIYVAGDLIIEVRSTPIDTHTVDHFQRERWHQQITTGKETNEQEWLHYVGTNHTAEPDNCTIKDRKVALAFPLDGATDGRLYNFLPTGIKTGLPFHINGAFFPDNNRHGILHDTSTNVAKSEWNFSVITTIARLFADALLDIRDQCVNPELFYQFWPVEEPTKGYELGAIRQQFIERARTSPIVYSTRNQWVTPEQIWIPQSENLRELAHNHADLLPTSAAEISTFIKKHLGAKQLNLRNLLEMIETHLRSGIELVDAHSMINTRKKLVKLYAELRNQSQHDLAWIRQQPIFLSERDTLEPVTALYSADEARRRLFSEDDRPIFVDIDFQAQLLKEYIDTFDGVAFVDWLFDWQQRNPGRAFFQNDYHLIDCLTVIDPQRQQVDQQKLSKLYMIRVEGRKELFSAAHEVYLTRNSRDYELGINNLLLVDKQLKPVQLVRDVYTAAGIGTLEPSHVVNLLRRGITDRSIQMDLPLARHVFDYLSANNQNLTSSEIDTLRTLPICYTANGRWVSAARQTDLSLKPEIQIRGWDEILSILDKLELDNYVHPDLQNYRALGKIGIRPLDEMTFNVRLVRQYYASDKLNAADRVRLLEYIRDTYSQIRDMEFQEAVKKTPLIYCHDERYRRASEVYFASPLLDDVFADDYHPPHPNYELTIADANDEDMRPYVRSEWYRFFADIGMREEPSPADIIERIHILTSDAPDNEHIAAIKRIVWYLNNLSKERVEAYTELAGLEWLPVGNDRWYRPSNVNLKKYASIVGQQAPTLNLDISSQLAQIVGIPERPHADLVARHLLHSAEHEQPIEDAKIYRYLGQYWNEVSIDFQSRLKKEAVIWDLSNERYWKPDFCFIGNGEGGYFGIHRHYRKPDDGHVGRFYDYVGIRETASTEQRLTFLRHLANTGAGSPLTEEDLALLKANLAYMGEHRDEHSGILPDVEKIRVVPNEEGYLHRSDSRIVLDDQPGLRKKFSNSDLNFVHKDFYVEQINHFWDAIGVARLSTATIQIADTGVKELDATLKRDFVDRIRYLRRVVYHKCGTTELPFDLRHLAVYICDRLKVRYSIMNLEGETVSEFVAFKHDTKEFFHVENASNIQIASQLIDVLQLRDEVDAPVIEAILSRRPAEIDAYLDECKYKPLPTEYIHPETPEQPLAGTSESDMNDFGDDVEAEDNGVYENRSNTSDDRSDDDDDEPDFDETHADDAGYRLYSGGWTSHTSHSPHYPNLLSELIDLFGVEQEFVEPPPSEEINIDEEEIFADMNDTDFDRNDEWMPNDWSDVFETDSPPVEPFFHKARPDQVFRDVQQLSRDVPKPEDRRGVFHLICKAFPKDGAVLHLHAIRSAVWSRRPGIAEGTISSILSRAFPCFESHGGGFWAFNAKYILEGYANMNAAVSAYNRWRSSRGNRSTPSSSHPYGSTGERQNSRNRPSTSRNQQSNRRAQVETSQSNMAQPDSSLRIDPIDLETFVEYVPHEFHETQLDVIYHTAQHTREKGDHHVSLYLFELLDKYGLDFSDTVHDLRWQIKLNSILAEIEAMPLDDKRRWSLWIDALQLASNDAHLLNAIQNSVRQAAETYGNQLKNGRDGDIETIARSVIDWLSGIHPLWIAWQRDEAMVLGSTACYLFDWLIEQKQVEIAVELIAQCPAESSLLKNDNWSINMTSYWSAIEVIVDYLNKHGEYRNAQIMQIYGAFVSRRSKQRLIDGPDYEQLRLEAGITSDDIIVVSSDNKLRRWLNPSLFQEIADL